MPGFGVKVTPKGRKVFLVMYRLAGAGSRLRKYTIGPYGRVTLPMAKTHVAMIGTSRRITSLLQRDVIPYWGAKSIHEIKKRA